MEGAEFMKHPFPRHNSHKAAPITQGRATSRPHVTLSPCHPVTLSLLLLALLFALAGCAAPVRVEWSTETEMNTAGFDLYRGTSQDGPFDVKVNDQLIPASPDPLTGGEYSFIDRTAQSGVTYYYQLQEVETTGAVNTHGPIAVRAGGFDWRHALVIGGLAIAAASIWVWGGRR